MLQTLFVEVEFIVNNRPLTHVSVNEKVLEAPNHYLYNWKINSPYVSIVEL